MPVANYMAGMRVTPVTLDGSGQTFAEWWAVFDVTAGPPQATADDIGDNVFVAGFAAIDNSSPDAEENTMTKIFVSAVIDAPIEKVWAQVRDFNNMPDWHPKFSRSHIEGGLPSDQVGCIRNFDIAGRRRHHPRTPAGALRHRAQLPLLHPHLPRWR